jgi:serine/threonine protein kinase
VIYIAPEVLRNKYTLSADLWSVGIIAYLLLTGQLPFAGEEGEEVSDLFIRKQTFQNRVRLLRAYPLPMSRNMHILQLAYGAHVSITVGCMGRNRPSGFVMRLHRRSSEPSCTRTWTSRHRPGTRCRRTQSTLYRPCSTGRRTSGRQPSRPCTLSERHGLHCMGSAGMLNTGGAVAWLAC